MTRGLEAPSAFAASVNGSSFNRSISPRAIRAGSIQANADTRALVGPLLNTFSKSNACLFVP
jgi:hypothetical protein